MPSEWAFTYTKSLKLAYCLTLLVYCVADVAHLSYGDIPACLYEAIPFILLENGTSDIAIGRAIGCKNSKEEEKDRSKLSCQDFSYNRNPYDWVLALNSAHLKFAE